MQNDCHFADIFVIDFPCMKTAVFIKILVKKFYLNGQINQVPLLAPNIQKPPI